MRLVEIFPFTIFFVLTPNIQPCFAKVIINEILPYPDDGIEAVELVFVPNDSSQTQINLLSWSIWDELATPSCLYTFGEETLSVGEFMIKTFSNKLNNSGDSVIIKNNNGEIQDMFTYLTSERSISFARLNFESDEFVLTPPSLGLANNISSIPNPTLTPSPTVTPASAPAETISPMIPDNNLLSPSSISTNLTQQPMVNIEQLQARHSQALEKIVQLKKELEAQSNQTELFFDINHISEKLHTTLKFETATISRPKILSVIIGGLLFLTASRLLYEER